MKKFSLFIFSFLLFLNSCSKDEKEISVLKEKAYSLGDEQILVDGFPRSSIQAESLKEIFLNKNLNIINFTVTDEELLARIKKRSQEESRADDSVFDKRLTIYKKTHSEIIESLSKNNEVINIDANDQIDSISQKIIEKLGLN